MALSEEFEEYLATGVSPKARGLLRKAALKMPQERRAGFLASLQQADFEFQGPIQDRMPEGAENVDPGRFRHHDYGSEIPYSALNRSIDLNVAGEYIAPEYGQVPYGASQEVKERYKKYMPAEQEVRTPYGTYSFPLESDTVNTYGKGNNPLVIAHEYRHRQDLEGLPKTRKGSPSRMEYLNKLQDLLGATNESELRQGLVLTAYTFKRLDYGKDDVERTREIEELADDPDTPLEELAEGARFFLNHHVTKNLMHESTMRSDKAGEDAPFKERISPDDFRRSDFYKTDIKEKSWLDKLQKAMRN